MIKLLTWLVMGSIVTTILWMTMGNIKPLTDNIAPKWLLVGGFTFGVFMGWLALLPKFMSLRWNTKKMQKDISQHKVVRERAKMASQLLN